MEAQSEIRKKNSAQRLAETNVDQGVTILDDMRENDKLELY